MPPASSSTEPPVTDQPSSTSEEHSSSQTESREEPPAEEHRKSPADPPYDSSNSSGRESEDAQETLLDKRLQFEDAEIEEPEGPPKITLANLSFWYGDNQALEDISMEIFPNEVTALIGPSGCGKSTLLRCLNRMNEMIDGTRLEGSVEVDGQNIYENADPVMVRRRIGMVFQKPNPFPKSIFDNVVWGARINGFTGDQDQLVEKCLRQAALWDEVKDRLDTSAYDLSGGQQQRLCIARALAVEPNVLLMDEPASALDPIATAKLEETIQELTKEYTIVIVTHNMQQAARISDSTAFLYMGRLIEMDRTDRLFTRPSKQQTENYITGRFG